MESTNTSKANYTNDKLSYSQLRMYRECRYKWYQYYERGLRLRGHDIARLHIGTLIHKGLELAFTLKWVNQIVRDIPGEEHVTYSEESMARTITEAIEQENDKYLDKLGGEITDEYRAENEEILERAIRVTIRAIEWLDLSKWEVVSVDGAPLVETKLSMGHNYWKAFVGKLDVVLRQKSTGNVYLVDAKCRDKFQTYENEETNEQFPIYQRLLNKLGVELSGVKTWQIKTREPVLPELTKKGELSRKKCTTDWETYCQAIDACGFNRNDYLGVQEWASKVEFQRFSDNYRSDIEVENIWQGIYATAKEMRSESLPIYRNLRPGFAGCHDCVIRERCLTDLRGGDVDWIEKNRYRHVTEPNVALPLVQDIILHE